MSVTLSDSEYRRVVDALEAAQRVLSMAPKAPAAGDLEVAAVLIPAWYREHGCGEARTTGEILDAPRNTALRDFADRWRDRAGQPAAQKLGQLLGRLAEGRCEIDGFVVQRIGAEAGVALWALRACEAREAPSGPLAPGVGRAETSHP